MIKSFSLLNKNLKKDFSSFKESKLAILGDTATQFLYRAIRGLGYENELNLKIFESDFNQIDLQVLDLNSDLYRFNPEVVIIFRSSHKLLEKYNKSITEKRGELALNEFISVKELCKTIQENSNANVIIFNYNEIDDTVFGNYGNKLRESFLFQQRELNFRIMEFSSVESGVHICDLSSIQNRVGKENMFTPSIYINTEMVLSIDILPVVASRVLDIISGLQGKLKKCLILDLDNTTWGGIIGDDGIENIQIGQLGIGKAFTEFQYWAKKLKQRGIILAICSKNTESVAKEPFEKHPDMVLRLDDISVFIANWENKADNIRRIQKILNISFDSMVFLDDNPFERNIVRENIPEMIVPELPEDPAEYLEYIYSLNLFETISHSKEDSKRTMLYQTEAKRVSIQQKFTNEDEFLKNLEMVSEVQELNKYNIPRVAQLSQRSNQFNLRTIRYSEGDIERINKSLNYFSFIFDLKDRFGDNGIICVVLLEITAPSQLFIDTWFMSCRVLKRGMENFVLNTLVDYAKKNNFEFIRGEYLPTTKNKMVRNHYQELGFKEMNGELILEISSYEKKLTHINKK